MASVEKKQYEFTCFLCKKKFQGLMEFVDHCPEQIIDYNVQCDDCYKITMLPRKEMYSRRLCFAKC